MKPTRDIALYDLAPLSCSQGGEFYGNSVLRVPTEMSPQKILHWVAGSALASIDPVFCKRLINGMTELGADFSAITVLRQLTGPTYNSQKACILSRIQDKPEGRGFQTTQVTLRLTQASPLGAVMVARNSQALALFLKNIEMGKPCLDIDSPVAITKSGKRLNAWSLAGVLRDTDAPSLLDHAFGVSGWRDPLHAKRLGEAVAVALRDNEAETRMPFDSQQGGLSKMVVELMLGGADLSPSILLACNIDPAWLTLSATRLEDNVAFKLVNRLVELQFPVDTSRATLTHPVHSACTQEKARTLVALLEAGANVRVTAKDDEGKLQTLQALAESKHPEMMAVIRSWTSRKLAMKTMAEFFHTEKRNRILPSIK